jgi:hypothetical protein
MISENTVFIVGAGASNPFGYPIGTELRRRIYGDFPKQLSILLTGQPFFNRDACPEKVKDALDFCQSFKEARIKSIDRYLAINQEFSEIGKLAIVLSILEAEKKPQFDDTLEDNWYFYLYNRMVDGFRSSDSYKQFGANKVSIVTFNYDRSLEHYFFTCLRNTFRKASEQEIVEQLNSIPVHHVYGQVDDLPWQGKGKKYGSGYDFDAALSVSRNNIRTMFERTESENEQVREILAKARSIYFLGFGYDESNMKIIGLPEVVTPGHHIYGTYKKAKQKEMNDVVVFRTRKNASSKLVHIVDCGCVDLLREYL